MLQPADICPINTADTECITEYIVGGSPAKDVEASSEVSQLKESPNQSVSSHNESATSPLDQHITTNQGISIENSDPADIDEKLANQSENTQSLMGEIAGISIHDKTTESKAVEYNSFQKEVDVASSTDIQDTNPHLMRTNETRVMSKPETIEDDFGDFDSVEPTNVQIPEPISIENVPVLPSIIPETCEQAENYLEKLLESPDASERYKIILGKLKDTFGIESLQNRTHGPVIGDAKGFWDECLRETNNDGQLLGFRWRKSMIRNDFVSIFLEPETHLAAVTSKPQTAAKVANQDETEIELSEARRICDITELELRGKTTIQLHALVAELKSSADKIQNQINSWMDAKEHLIIDSEMHNKMIASLVSYAQQQQISNLSFNS